MVTKKFKIIDMHCTSCAMTIDMDLEDLEGIKSARTNYAKAVTEIELDPNKVGDEKVLQTIKKSGYIAQPLDS